MKRLIMLVTLLVAFCAGMVTAWAKAPSVVDEAHVLTFKERQKLISILEEYEQRHQVRMAVVTKQSIGNAVPGQYANRLIDEVYNDGPRGNMVLLQVVDQSKWYISTDRKLKQVVVGTAGTEYMSKAFVPKLRKQPLEAYTIYAKKASELLDYYDQYGQGWMPSTSAGKQYAKENNTKQHKTDWFPILLIAGVGSVIITSSYRKNLISAMSNVQDAVGANAYVERDKFELVRSSDNYLFSNTIVTPRSKGRDNDDSGFGGVSDNSSDGGHGGGGGNY